MTLVKTPGALKKFIRTPWRFQQTFQTPLQDLERFVSVIMAANPAQTATVTIQEIVFECDTLNASLGVAPGTLRHNDSITASDGEAGKLLFQCLSGWIDFLYTPSPKPFIIYADHDEYATFYANTKSGLNQVIIPLRDAGFKIVDDWTRTF
ncbi:MAG TPA: hypothetical protein VMZ27_06090 [Candidatus Saccharimonadales bacterium]|nr:hypothetical protein [Candidatus Saccharimonadales bacterium]